MLTSGRRAPCAASSLLTSLRHPREGDADAALRGFVRETLDGFGGRRADERHGGEIDDEIAMRVADTLQHDTDGRGGAEEKRAGNPVDDDGGILPGRFVAGLPCFVVRNVLRCQRTSVSSAVVCDMRWRKSGR